MSGLPATLPQPGGGSGFAAAAQRRRNQQARQTHELERDVERLREDLDHDTAQDPGFFSRALENVRELFTALPQAAISLTAPVHEPIRAGLDAIGVGPAIGAAADATEGVPVLGGALEGLDDALFSRAGDFHRTRELPGAFADSFSDTVSRWTPGGRSLGEDLWENPVLTLVEDLGNVSLTGLGVSRAAGMSARAGAATSARRAGPDSQLRRDLQERNVMTSEAIEGRVPGWRQDRGAEFAGRPRHREFRRHMDEMRKMDTLPETTRASAQAAYTADIVSRPYMGTAAALSRFHPPAGRDKFKSEDAGTFRDPATGEQVTSMSLDRLPDWSEASLLDYLPGLRQTERRPSLKDSAFLARHKEIGHADLPPTARRLREMRETLQKTGIPQKLQGRFGRERIGASITTEMQRRQAQREVQQVHGETTPLNRINQVAEQLERWAGFGHKGRAQHIAGGARWQEMQQRLEQAGLNAERLREATRRTDGVPDNPLAFRDVLEQIRQMSEHATRKRQTYGDDSPNLDRSDWELLNTTNFDRPERIGRIEADLTELATGVPIRDVMGAQLRYGARTHEDGPVSAGEQVQQAARATRDTARTEWEQGRVQPGENVRTADDHAGQVLEDLFAKHYDQADVAPESNK